MQQGEPQTSEAEERNVWKDKMTEVQSTQYAKRRSYWHRSNPEHVKRLKQMMTTWIVEERCKQEEPRLRLVTFVTKAKVNESEDTTEGGSKPTSYLKAVAAG
ncbi:unnamed protein product [Phytophthora fragariaefolia]|uniref:Unnamed protein product n=1 Tax=Phytophthora fragariaefolia TaxID=1490495 RepID=A0A9W7D1Y0_9STRA|nr:unnamed protein product [Phytophthora fragariaefolia]